MTRISRLLATLTGVALLCLAHFASVAHAGITNITVDISHDDAHAYGAAHGERGILVWHFLHCPSGPAYLWSQPAASGTITSATPIHGQLGASATNSLANMPTMPNTCTVTQLTRPNAPAGYLCRFASARRIDQRAFAGNPAPYLAALRTCCRCQWPPVLRVRSVQALLVARP
jgi:hypothetical protein